MECRHLKSSRFLRGLQEKSAMFLIGPMWPPCNGVSGLPVARTSGANRIRPACRYAADAGSRCSGVNGRPLTTDGWGKRTRAAWRYAEEPGRVLNRIQRNAAIHQLSRSARGHHVHRVASSGSRQFVVTPRSEQSASRRCTSSLNWSRSRGSPRREHDYLAIAHRLGIGEAEDRVALNWTPGSRRIR